MNIDLLVKEVIKRRALHVKIPMLKLLETQQMNEHESSITSILILEEPIKTANNEILPEKGDPGELVMIELDVVLGITFNTTQLLAGQHDQ